METNKLPTAKEFYDAHYSDDAVVMMREFAKLHVKAALEAASEKAERKMTTSGWCNACNRGTTYINENSILNAYPENLIT